MELFQSKGQFFSACTQDLTWLLLCLHSTSVFQESGCLSPEQSIPGWSWFHSRYFSTTPVTGMTCYCPMMNASVNEFNTIFTLMKVSQEMARQLQQGDAVITFDLSIYMKAKQLQLKFPGEFKNTLVIRMGGFHIALNYLALLGKNYASSGLGDLLIEYRVYAAGTTSIQMLGKSYNRGIFAHKLTTEALLCLMWKPFLRWVINQREEVSSHCKEAFISEIQECQRCFREEPIQQSFDVVLKNMNVISPFLNAFKTEAKERSRLFNFWEEHISMVTILLQFVKAEHTGNWSLHLASMAAMIPHFFAMNRSNYTSWLPSYLADRHKLEERHP